MRIKITYKTSRIPSSYRMMMVSLLKKSLSDYNPELFNELYFYENNTKNKKSKNFAFSVFMKNFSKDGEEFVTDEISLNISSPDKKLMFHLYNALNRLKTYTHHSKCTLEKKDIKILYEKSIPSDYAVFKTMSPIVVKNKQGLFLDLDSLEYIESLNYIIDISLRNYRGYGLSKPVEFIPIDMKKVVAKEDIKSSKESTFFQCVYINAFKGVFALKGEVEDLNDIYSLGLGFKRNQGFGMVDLI